MTRLLDGLDLMSFVNELAQPHIGCSRANEPWTSAAKRAVNISHLLRKSLRTCDEPMTGRVDCDESVNLAS